jgi:hypothetical protein
MLTLSAGFANRHHLPLRHQPRRPRLRLRHHPLRPLPRRLRRRPHHHRCHVSALSCTTWTFRVMTLKAERVPHARPSASSCACKSVRARTSRTLNRLVDATSRTLVQGERMSIRILTPSAGCARRPRHLRRRQHLPQHNHPCRRRRFGAGQGWATWGAAWGRMGTACQTSSAHRTTTLVQTSANSCALTTLRVAQSTLWPTATPTTTDG